MGFPQWRTLLLVGALAGAPGAEEERSLEATWDMPPRCDPFAAPRIADLKDELARTGYRLVVAIHPKKPDESKGETLSRDLYLMNADGTGLKPIASTPDTDEYRPRVSPDGQSFTYNGGDFLVDVKTLKTTRHDGGYVWTPDSRKTCHCTDRGIVYTEIQTGKNSIPAAAPRKVGIVDLTPDGAVHSVGRFTEMGVF
jgi:hypothetical protein